MGSRKINDLGASTFLFSVICDRALDSRTSRPRPHADVCVTKQKREQGKPTTVSDAGDLVQVGTGKDHRSASGGTVEVGAVFGKPEVPAVVLLI